MFLHDHATELKPLYLHYHNAYGHQTYHGSDVQ